MGVVLRATIRLSGALGLAAALTLAVSSMAFGQRRAPSFVPPPRTIADITAILDQEKPDPKVAAKLRADADAQPSSGMSQAALARFHYDRCQARTLLGELRRAFADCERAVQLGEGSLRLRDFLRMLQGLAVQYRLLGEPKRALEVSLRRAKDAKLQRFNANRHIAASYIALGDLTQAEVYVRKNIALIQEARGWPTNHAYGRANGEGEVELGKGLLHEARGQFQEAEAAYRQAQILKIEAIQLRHMAITDPPSPKEQAEQLVDDLMARQGRMKARQGRMAEGEVDVRRALLSRLKAVGKYNVQTAKYVGYFANLLVEAGRFAEAETLSRARIEILRAVSVAEDSQSVATALSELASILNLQGRWEAAAKVYAELDQATSSWSPARKIGLTLDINRIATLYNTNNLPAGISAAERLLARSKARFSEQHVNTALAGGMLAIGLARAGRDGEALRQFKLSMPILVAASREIDSDDATEAAAHEQRAQIVIEAYIALLARMERAPGDADTAAETFRLADVIRSHSVQKAITASSARAVAEKPSLSELARKAQDLEKQVVAQLGVLNNALTLSPDQRDDKVLKALQADIDKLRAARDAAKRDLAGRFREYASLVEPKPPTAEEIRAVLRPEEAFISFYFGRQASFVWAVPKIGPVAFAAIPLTAGDLEVMVGKLREALEPNAETIEEIPPFDLRVAHELYRTLLAPVEVGWRSAKSLIMVTNGALGLLPLGLLPTTPSREPESKHLFDGYRQVSWLVRTHAVSQVPSAAALRTLRQLPPGSTRREPLVGFGDPLFSAQQAAEEQRIAEAIAAAQVSAAGSGIPLRRRAIPQTRRVDSADLALLPRLRDTADELKSVALALEADPAKVLYLGKEANEGKVKSTDLSRFRIIAFATHGLVPGDLNGLTQPALALTAPSVADVDGDGLLTMEEILALKLDADWVVLSACNTASGASAGAEAVSGLGRAFFYAAAARCWSPTGV